MRILNSLQLRNKKLAIIACVLFLASIGSVAAYSIGVSPSGLYFSGSKSEKICRQIEVFSDNRLVIFKLYDKWSINGGKELSDYRFNAEDLGIHTIYRKFDTNVSINDSSQGQSHFENSQKNSQGHKNSLWSFYGSALLEVSRNDEVMTYPYYTEVFDKKELNVCLTAENAGNYDGVLFIESENDDAGLGVWVHANISGREKGGSTVLTGLSIKDESNDKNRQGRLERMFLILWGIFIFLMCVLLIGLASKNSHTNLLSK